ncbi:BtrH N-terminal domain-containing protein [Myxococcus sp. K15C18031901]|uniref:BtrH N-terminal domain-containing protein n=1 Tax=Myxococcus dinghuensis TaxID=2906761 RepID=UPI0020A7F308|nr:BtrH N-terminal domain-containing protein [Myxococcus dinghuensis]MCP3098085.1 BtrH N-terminal domain-containing protein [Myxococcus dinghuensis]
MNASSVLERYRHQQGLHCESACQRNILSALGTEVDESVLFGLDGAFGLSYFASPLDEPDIVVGKQTLFPLQAARLMGIQVDQHKDAGAAPLISLLEKRQVVVARLDIGQLDYWKLQGKVSFGGYFVNIVGYDPGAGSFQVSDPAFAEPQWVDAEQLVRARSSRLSPPINPENRCYVVNAPKGAPKLDKVGPVAVRNICREVLRPDLRNFGLPGIKMLQDAARKWPATKVGDVVDVDLRGKQVECDALTRQLVYLGRQIELFGTGGGLFRPMLSRFLTAVGEATGRDVYAGAARTLAESGEVWSALGQQLMSLGAEGRRARAEALVEPLVESLQKVSQLEKRAFESLKDC